MRQIWYLVGWGHQFVTPCLTQLAFPQVYIGLYSLPRRRWLFIYKWGCVSSFLLYLSELSFVIGITAEKINTATDNIYPQFLVGLPCKPGSPVKIPAIALGAIFFFPGDLRSTSQPGWSLQMSNEEELQNNFSLLPMVTWPGPFQCWLETLNTSKTKPVSTASGPTFDQIAWICTIPTSKSTGRLSILSDSVSPTKMSTRWASSQSTFCHFPEEATSPSPPRIVLPSFGLDKEVFSPMSTYTKEDFLLWWKKWTSPKSLTSPRGKLAQCYPCGTC